MEGEKIIGYDADGAIYEVFDHGDHLILSWRKTFSNGKEYSNFIKLHSSASDEASISDHFRVLRQQMDETFRKLEQKYGK